MVIAQTLQNFLVNQPLEVNYLHLIFALVLAVVFAIILKKIYVRYGRSLSNRKAFAENFLLLIPTTTLIIIIVKSSLALSLGLVGALSIVRFRTAIKEPEELAFLFLSIGIGLGLGAGQFIVTVISIFIILFFILSRNLLFQKEENQNLYLTISGQDISLKKIVTILQKYCSAVELKRFDKDGDGILEASFFIDLPSFRNLEGLKEGLENIFPELKMSYLSKSGLY